MRKRFFDIAASFGGLLLAMPAMVCIAICIKVSSPGPIIFTQERVGRNGEIFRIHKFRTMAHGMRGPLISSKRDLRITRVGRFLRQMKLDELPQLYDVLRGAMSLVGPRPEVPQYVAAWPSDLRSRILTVRPGITDPASIVYRDEADELAAAFDPERHYLTEVLPKKAALYADYVENRSFKGDLAILARTIKVVVVR